MKEYKAVSGQLFFLYERPSFLSLLVLRAVTYRSKNESGK